MRLENGDVYLDIAEDYGPRIAAYGFAGEQSVLAAAPDAVRDTPHGTWRAYGGHRMWIAPERFPETYRIDDAPPALVRRSERSVSLAAARDALGIVSTLDIVLAEHGSTVSVAHVADNAGTEVQRIAPWGLSIVTPGGTFVLPAPRFAPHPDALLPARTLTLWPYARLDDPRVQWDGDAIRVACDPAHAAPWKIGASLERGWCAYAVESTLFVKAFPHDTAATYPDLGCSAEIFTAGAFGELETLGPLQTLAPGERVTHVERWSLHAASASPESLAALPELAAW